MKSYQIGLLIALIGIMLVTMSTCALGVGGFGPTETQVVTVSKTYIDVSGSGKDASSHYIVATDKGSFEVDNGVLLGIWNADDIYGKIVTGKTYKITTMGKRYQNFFMQEFPYIVKVDTAGAS